MALICGHCGGDIAVPTKENRTDTTWDQLGQAICEDCGRICKIGE